MTESKCRDFKLLEFYRKKKSIKMFHKIQNVQSKKARSNGTLVKLVV